MSDFQQEFAKTLGRELNSYDELHQASVQHSDEFWQQIIDYFGVIGEGSTTPVNTDNTFNTYGWLPEFRLNFAENLLAKGADDACAIQTLHESGKQSRLTYAELRSKVAQLQTALANYIEPGDVVACYMPNIAETVITMLATTSLGGVFTSTSCDFGIEGVVDRFGNDDHRGQQQPARHQSVRGADRCTAGLHHPRSGRRAGSMRGSICNALRRCAADFSCCPFSRNRYARL